MMASTNTIRPADFTPSDKIKFVAVTLPLLGIVGGVLRATGSSEQAVLVAVVPLLVLAFVGWRYGATIKRARGVASEAEQRMWEERDTRLRQSRQLIIDSQQEELRSLRVRQEAEQMQMMRERASAEQLARMMERHRDEYESILGRRSA